MKRIKVKKRELNINRRTFLKGAAAGLAGARLVRWVWTVLATSVVGSISMTLSHIARTWAMSGGSVLR